MTNEAQAQETPVYDIQQAKRRVIDISSPNAAQELGEHFKPLFDPRIADKVVAKFDVNAEFPENHNLVILPITENVKTAGDAKSTRVVKQIVVAAVPNLSVFEADEKGRAWLRELMLDGIVNKMASAARSGLDKIPETVAAFIESSREKTVGAFGEFAEALMTHLRNAGLDGSRAGIPNITKARLKDCLQSEAMAKAIYPGIGQNVWDALLDSTINAAAAKGLPHEELKNWKETRYHVVDAVDASIDFSNLSL